MTVRAEDLHAQRAAGALLTARYNDYLAAAERDAGLPAGSVPRPVGKVSFSRELLPGRKPPYLVVACPGNQDPPERHGRRYGATIRMGLCAVVSGGDWEETEERAKLHAAALRDCLIDHSDLGGAATACDWIGRRYDLIDADRSRTLGSCEVLFAVDIRQSTTLEREPVAPDGQPISWPAIDRATTLVVERSAA